MISRVRLILWPEDRARRFLTLLCMLFLILQALQILIFPPFTGHDEVAHFDYVRTVAEEHRLPVVPELDEWRAAAEANQPLPGDYLDADLYRYCRYTLDWPCYPEVEVFQVQPPRRDTSDRTGLMYPAGWQYAANHPPLLYFLATPIYWATDGMGLGMQLRVLRTLAIPFGLLAIVSTFAIGRLLAPTRPAIAVIASAFLAFQPQISYEAAMLNNDITVIGTGALIVALLLKGLRDRFAWKLAIGIGVVFGCSLLFKGTSIVFAPVIAVGYIAGYGLRNVRQWISKGVVTAGIGFAMASPWYLHLHRTYGNFDGLTQVSRIQAAWNYTEGTPGFFEKLTDGSFIARLWQETWGGYGWRRIALDTPLLTIIGVVMVLCGVGLLLFGFRYARARMADSGQAQSVFHRAGLVPQTGGASLIVLVVTVGISYLAVIEFGTRFQLSQARYYFPAIPALAVLLAFGLTQITPRKLQQYLPVLAVAFFLGLQLYILTAYAIPYWHTGPVR